MNADDISTLKQHPNIHYMNVHQTIREAIEAHEWGGGILLVLDDGTYGTCFICRTTDKCDKCGRSAKWLESLAPSWSEAAPENALRDPRNKTTKGAAIVQGEMF